MTDTPESTEPPRSLVARAKEFFSHGLWQRDSLASRPLQWARRLLQSIVMIMEGFLRNQLILRANALTYLIMLSLIPLLAITVAVARALGMDGTRLLDVVTSNLAVSIPGDVQNTVISSIENVNFGGLGGLGAGFFVLTTVMAIGSVEKAFNQIWRVKEMRPWVRRVPDYMAVVFIVPMVMGISSTLSATLHSQWLVQRLLEYPFFETLYSTSLRFMPFALLTLGYAFVYWFLPNTKVKISSALFGALIAAILFTAAQNIYVSLNVGVAKYNAFFGGFAFLPLLMVWIYISWVITLLGSEIAFAHQNLKFYSRELRNPDLDPADLEAVGLAMALEIARTFRDGDPPWTDRSLADAIDIPIRTIRDILGDLEKGKILIQVASDDPLEHFQLRRPAEQISVVQVLEALCGRRHPRLEGVVVVQVANQCLDRIDSEALGATGGNTLADLLKQVPVGGREDRPD